MGWMGSMKRQTQTQTAAQENENMKPKDNDSDSLLTALFLATVRTWKTIFVRWPLLIVAFYLLVRIGNITDYPR
ncbi:hypothetical protein QBC32DRAFT_220292 [Pseudoneurospora amorphoporcata]|uniref:Uncharacterized protein n=1 Tax=Pseudoneurospora amorphoporcata TaxID=241081 RepID=A0AAN6NQB3_9PEZI|nr:hypothetical protein QBC32DRAFT_220292 [Pseudoneurospora amorphoporcata]